MKKRVLMIVPSFSAMGGITAVVSGYRGSKLEEDYDVKYIETYCDGSRFLKTLKALKGYLSFVMRLLFWRPKIVHIHSSFGASFYRKKPFIDISDLFGVFIVNHIHGSYYDEFYLNAGRPKQKKIEKTYNKCSAIVALSDQAKKELSNIVDEKGISVIQNYGIENEDALKQRMFDRERKTVLFLGFISEKKGCFDIPEICRLVSKRVENVIFIVAGSGEIEEMKRRTEAEVADRFEFPGWVRNGEKDRALRDADVYLLPSYSEAMPMSILDAMGYGLPIVSTTVGGIPTLVKNGENGFLLEPGDCEGMSEAIVRLLKDGSLRKKTGRNGLERIREHFSLDKHINELEKVYEKKDSDNIIRTERRRS